MIGYVMVGSNDLARAKAFYDPVLAPLGLSLNVAFTSDSRIWYAAGETPPMFVVGAPHDGRPATWGNGGMVALAATDREAVDSAYRLARDLGAIDEGEPGDRGGGFYGAYFRDPDGNKLCVYHWSAPA